jgi:UDP-3-O-[3-hydroxymyristoyl] glucosamine N-acyltransferase
MVLSLARIAEIVGGEVKGDIQKMICGAAPFETATPDDITLAVNAGIFKKNRGNGRGSRPGAQKFQGMLQRHNSCG